MPTMAVISLQVHTWADGPLVNTTSIPNCPFLSLLGGLNAPLPNLPCSWGQMGYKRRLLWDGRSADGGWEWGLGRGILAKLWLSY